MKSLIRTLLLSILLFLINTSSAQLIHPEDMHYQGAFRVPDTQPFEESWNWGGTAMAYYPWGDPGGGNDGYFGSIYGVGHDWNMMVAEITIPQPVISPFKNPSELNTAQFLQTFRDVRGGLFPFESWDLIRVGMAYLPAQDSQITDKLHLCWGRHFQFEQEASLMWCELDLSSPQTAGGWYFGDVTNYVTNDYLFDIPQNWVDNNIPGQHLASGRFRDGGWGGQGPALYAYGPWNDGNPPARDDTLWSYTPLLLYGIHQPGVAEITNADSMMMDQYKEADEWTGGAWLTAGTNTAVIFLGTKGVGNCWYGLPDGTVWPDSPPYPDDPMGLRGWWADSFKAQILFYDPAELAAVTDGTLESYHPQPYDTLDIDSYLFAVDSTQQKDHVGAICFDRNLSNLFVFERRADDDKPLVHVWNIDCDCAAPVEDGAIREFSLEQNYPNPFNGETTISYYLTHTERVKLSIYNNLGALVATPVDGRQTQGSHTVIWDGTDRFGNPLSSGIFFYRIKIGNTTESRKMLLLK